MDCQTFLEELKDCYKINGIEFPDSLLFYRSNSSTRVPFNGKPAKHDRLKNQISSYAYAKVGNATPSYKHYNAMSKQKIKVFTDFRDMVYTLAWELSERIGRLPDSLHARMVLSIDGHPMVKSYIGKWGV